MTAATRIVIMAKAPVAGLAKTRLAPLLGDAGAAQLARRMLLHTVEQACAARVGTVELAVTPPQPDRRWSGIAMPPDVRWSAQPDGDLGARLAAVASRVLSTGERVLLAGTDCPGLDASLFRRAAASLDHADAVMLPTFDGGYALLGLRAFNATVFDSVPWSTVEVAAITRERVRGLGWNLVVGQLVGDVDEPDDLRWLPPGWLQRSQDDSL